MQRKGYVYFLLAEHGLCKIGRAVDPWLRLSNFARLSNLKFIMFHFIASNDAVWLEAKLHKFFAHARIKGEWFALDNEELDQIRQCNQLDTFVIKGRDLTESNGIPETGRDEMKAHAQIMGSKGGKKGGPARSQKLTKAELVAIARKGGMALAAKKRRQQWDFKGK